MNDKEMLKQDLMDKRMTLAMLLFNNEDSLSDEEKLEVDISIRNSHLHARNENLELAMACVESGISKLESLNNG